MDVVVTLALKYTAPAHPAYHGLAAWVAEGDAAGMPDSGQVYQYSLAGRPATRPNVQPGDRVYVVHNQHLIGYALLTRLVQSTYRRNLYFLERGGGAVAVTIDEAIPGFHGWCYRWWDRAVERPFPDWHTVGRGR